MKTGRNHNGFAHGRNGCKVGSHLANDRRSGVNGYSHVQLNPQFGLYSSYVLRHAVDYGKGGTDSPTGVIIMGHREPEEGRYPSPSIC